jgi:hypothetical protein
MINKISKAGISRQYVTHSRLTFIFKVPYAVKSYANTGQRLAAYFEIHSRNYERLNEMTKILVQGKYLALV